MFMFPTAEQYEKETKTPGIKFSFFQDPKSTAIRQSAACIGAPAGRRTANWVAHNNKSPLNCCFSPLFSLL